MSKPFSLRSAVVSYTFKNDVNDFDNWKSSLNFRLAMSDALLSCGLPAK